MSQFYIALNGGTELQRNLLTNYLVRKGWPYWHWIDDFWIAQTPSSITAKALHLEIEALPFFGQPTLLIFQGAPPDDYWGRASNDAWDWLSKLSPSNRSQDGT